jgi:hypothetical protein
VTVDTERLALIRGLLADIVAEQGAAGQR